MHGGTATATTAKIEAALSSLLCPKAQLLLQRFFFRLISSMHHSLVLGKPPLCFGF